MAFASNRDADWGSYVGEVLKANVQHDIVLFLPKRVTFTRFYDGHPAWSPDGERIAFTSDRGLRWQIFLTRSFGADQTPFPGDRAASQYCLSQLVAGRYPPHLRFH